MLCAAALLGCGCAPKDYLLGLGGSAGVGASAAIAGGGAGASSAGAGGAAAPVDCLSAAVKTDPETDTDQVV